MGVTSPIPRRGGSFAPDDGVSFNFRSRYTAASVQRACNAKQIWIVEGFEIVKFELCDIRDDNGSGFDVEFRARFLDWFRTVEIGGWWLEW